MLNNTMAARMPRMAITTSSSTSVKPAWWRRDRRRASLSLARSILCPLLELSVCRLVEDAGGVALDRAVHGALGRRRLVGEELGARGNRCGGVSGGGRAVQEGG